MRKGAINVQSENIFPIIKKFLYSDEEIFLRELVSNAVDATQKLSTLSNMGEVKGELGDISIEVKVDEKKKTISVIDRGIGMTEDEVDKYINQIAFSSAEEFLEKFKNAGKESNIIGHFGLGFYSAFMVSEKVELVTQSYKDVDAVKWSCEGNPEFTLEPTKKKERGTEIILHVNKESEEFLQKSKIESILKKHCAFLPIEIKFDGNTINNTNPTWTKAPNDLQEEDYKNFYKELYPFTEEPLFWIHLNVDYPFNLTGVLYFPKLTNQIEVQKNKIQLYSNQVYVTDNVEDIVPEFLTLLHGVIDSPDIPLNVSRSYLQGDPNVKKISNYITKKVADKLEDLYKKDRVAFNNKWDDISMFIKYGMLTEEKFYDRAEKFVQLKNTNDEYFTLEEYQAKVKDVQTDKTKKTVYLYATDKVEQFPYIESATNKGYDVLLLDSTLDSHLIGQLEQKLTDVSFSRVDADTIDNLIEKEEEVTSSLNEEQEKQLKELIEKSLHQKENIVFRDLGEKEAPLLITKPEFTRRMKEMAQAQGGMSYMNDLPDQFNVVVNTQHPVINKILIAPEEEQTKYLKHSYDLALLSQNMLKGKELNDFMKRSIEFLN